MDVILTHLVIVYNTQTSRLCRAEIIIGKVISGPRRLPVRTFILLLPVGAVIGYNINMIAMCMLWVVVA
jgi:hypothetical protein